MAMKVKLCYGKFSVVYLNASSDGLIISFESKKTSQFNNELNKCTQVPRIQFTSILSEYSDHFKPLWTVKVQAPLSLASWDS